MQRTDSNIIVKRLYDGYLLLAGGRATYIGDPIKATMVEVGIGHNGWCVRMYIINFEVCI